jgi:hypothetical protein
MKLSKKRAAEMRVYRKGRIEFLNENPECAAKLPGCTGQATQVHHQKGRIGANLNDRRFWMAICHNCHTRAENDPKEAKERGFSLNRLT